MPSGANRLVSLFPRSSVSAPVNVRVEGAGRTLEIGVRRAVPSQWLLDPQGNLLLASGSGGVTLDGQRSVEGDGQWTAVSLDGHPLGDSGRLALASTAQGEIRWRSRVETLRAYLAERRGGTLCCVAEVPMTRAGDNWKIDTAANELYLVSGSQEAIAAPHGNH
jgi:hypothetical protein